MLNRSSKAKRPHDPNQLAELIVDIATGEREDERLDQGKNPHAVALGRLGGQKGGKARAEKLSAGERAEIARRAAHARWGESNDQQRRAGRVKPSSASKRRKKSKIKR